MVGAVTVEGVRGIAGGGNSTKRKITATDFLDALLKSHSEGRVGGGAVVMPNVSPY